MTLLKLHRAASWEGLKNDRHVALIVVALALSSAACGQSSPTVLIAYRTEVQAQAHCPEDTVVWVEPQNGGYYLKGQVKFGSGGAGRYACRGEAERAGMRLMPN